MSRRSARHGPTGTSPRLTDDQNAVRIYAFHAMNFEERHKGQKSPLYADLPEWLKAKALAEARIQRAFWEKIDSDLELLITRFPKGVV